MGARRRTAVLLGALIPLLMVATAPRTEAIVGGGAANLMEYGGNDNGVVVRVLTHVKANLWLACTGTLISRRIVLTANHCLDADKSYSGANAYKIAVGETTTGSNYLGQGQDTFREQPVCAAFQLGNGYYANLSSGPKQVLNTDLAYLVLGGSSKFSDRAGPLPLADPTADSGLWSPGARITEYGWGRTDLQKVCSYTKSLKSVGLTVDPSTKASTGTLQLKQNAEPPNLCHGDSGGPAIAAGKVIGVLSKGSGGTKTDVGCHSTYQSTMTATPGNVYATLQNAILGNRNEFPSTLPPNTALYAGDDLVSPGGGWGLLMQPDGNLIAYTKRGNVIDWQSNTGNHPGAWADMQSDGNFVIYRAGMAPTPGAALCNTGTQGHAPEGISIDDSGNLNLWGVGHTLLWSSRYRPSGGC